IADFFILLDSWFFHIFRPYAALACYVLLMWFFASQLGMILFTLYVGYLALNLIGMLVVLGYSPAPGRDLLTCAVLPLVPFYQLFLRVVRLVAVTQELFWRASFEDDFVPARVRETTWHW